LPDAGHACVPYKFSLLSNLDLRTLL
jgi:hypothetical protein